MVLPEFLRKTGSTGDGYDTKEKYMVDLPGSPAESECDSEPDKVEIQTRQRRKTKLRSKWIMFIVVVVLVLAALAVGVSAFIHKGSHDSTKSVGCDWNIHKFVHKGKVVHEDGSDRIRIECDEGHKLIGSPVIECLSSGHWSQTPTCVPKECKNLPVPDHAHVNLDSASSSILKEFKVFCHEGYFLEGNQTVVCQSDETWSPVPICKPVDCGDPGNITNGKIRNVAETTFNNSFQVECDEGYYLETGNETVICESGGKWDELPVCAPVSCEQPPSLNHARIQTIEGSLFGDSVVYQCLEGFEMHGDPTIICQSDKNWSPSPVCVPVNCGYPPHIDNGRVKNLGETVFNSVFGVDCDFGYTIKGNARVRCESSGKWGHIPVCEKVSCGLSSIPHNANILGLAGMRFRDTVTFRCTTGYRMRGNPTVTCQGNGLWTQHPTCEYSDPCYSNPCYHGNCVATGHSYTCTSSHSSGYSGIFCDPMHKKISVLMVSLLVVKILMIV